MRLLVIEDEPRIAEFATPLPERVGFAVDFVRMCAEGSPTLASHSHDAAILDLGWLDGDGLNLLAELSARRDRLAFLGAAAAPRCRPWQDLKAGNLHFDTIGRDLRLWENYVQPPQGRKRGLAA
jgi:DNA-binding NtrC family response regulator